METRGKFIVGMEPTSCRITVAADTEDNRDNLIVLASDMTLQAAQDYKADTEARIALISQRHCASCE